MDITNYMITAIMLPVIASLLILTPSSVITIPKRRLTLFLTLFATGVGAIISILCSAYLFNNTPAVFEQNFTFLSVNEFKIHIGIYLDNLSAFMMCVLTTISFFVQLFSYRYMQNEEHFDRYFILLNLFNFAMAGLLLSTNLIQTYMFFEIVGIISYLLIGFHYRQPLAQNAARKAFILNRVGDFAFFCAVMTFVYFTLQTNTVELTYPLLSFSDVNGWGFLSYVQLGGVLYTILSMLLVIAACAKSAQVPFHIWLIDAMQAPTPVSALIHSATMVGAGVYLLARVYPALILSPLTLKLIAIIGIITAIMCAMLALVQNDIKKLLAYSTASQLGLMFLALGAGAYAGAVFHLALHAYIKALLFLCAGVVIHYTYEQNIKSMGGLREYMPITAAMYLVGCFSLAGILLSGFYSKEMILLKLYNTRQFAYLGCALFAGFLSVLYIFKSYFLIFEGKYKCPVDLTKVRPSVSMTLSICALALPAAFLGAFLNNDFQRHIYLMRQQFYIQSNGLLQVSGFIISILAIYLIFQIYMTHHIKVPKIKPLYRLFVFQFYIDRFFTYLYKSGLKGLAKIINFTEKYILDGFNKLLALIFRLISYTIGKTQSGNINAYIFYGFALIVAIMLFSAVIYFKGLI